jgi:hypothetical protein
MRSISVLFPVCLLAACDKQKSADSPKTSLPFTSGVLKDGSTVHSLRLPDGSHLTINAITSSNATTIKTLTVIQGEGIPFAADYQRKEYLYSSPPFQDFQIWEGSRKGPLTIASEERHKKHAEASGLLRDFFERTLQSGMSADEAMKEAQKVKATLDEIDKEK